MPVCSPLVWTLIAFLSLVLVILALGVTDLLCNWYSEEESYVPVVREEVIPNPAFELHPPRVDLTPTEPVPIAVTRPSFAAAAAAVGWTPVVPIRVRSTASPLLRSYRSQRDRYVGPERLV
jgi:hypothetical protein